MERKIRMRKRRAKMKRRKKTRRKRPRFVDKICLKQRLINSDFQFNSSHSYSRRMIKKMMQMQAAK
jgi:hypothetical protein